MNHGAPRPSVGEVGTVRRLMSALSYYLSRRVLHPYAAQIVALLGQEESTADSRRLGGT
jgi:hypothetical protein